MPWAAGAPHPLLVAWLDQPGLELAGADVLVVGSGLGDDAEELARRGARVTAFDVSATAVAWAERRFPDSSVAYRVADLFDPPAEWRLGFGLVVEVRTVQSFPAELRPEAVARIAGFVAPGGYAVVVTLLATSDQAARGWRGPPFALAPAELADWRVAGLERLDLAHPTAPQVREVMEVVATFGRPAEGQPSMSSATSVG